MHSPPHTVFLTPHDGGVFISFRSDDGEDEAGRLSRQLTKELGTDRVYFFRDRPSPGSHVLKRLEALVRSSGVVLAVIGPNWFRESTLQADASWVRDDPVHVELRTAVRHRVPVIAVLVRGADPPPAHRLPQDIRQAFAGREYFRMGPLQAGADLARLVDHLRKAVPSLGPNPTHLLRRADVALRRGDANEARRLLQTVLASGDRACEAEANLTLAAIADKYDGNPHSTRRFLQAAAGSRDRDVSPRAWAALGTYHAQRHEFAEAVRCLEVAVDAKHREVTPKALLMLGNVKLADKDPDAALHYFSRAAASGDREVASIARSKIARFWSRR